MIRNLIGGASYSLALLAFGAAFLGGIEFVSGMALVVVLMAFAHYIMKEGE